MKRLHFSQEMAPRSPSTRGGGRFGGGDATITALQARFDALRAAKDYAKLPALERQLDAAKAIAAEQVAARNALAERHSVAAAGRDKRVAALCAAMDEAAAARIWNEAARLKAEAEAWAAMDPATAAAKLEAEAVEAQREWRSGGGGGTLTPRPPAQGSPTGRLPSSRQPSRADRVVAQHQQQQQGAGGGGSGDAVTALQARFDALRAAEDFAKLPALERQLDAAKAIAAEQVAARNALAERHSVAAAGRDKRVAALCAAMDEAAAARIWNEAARLKAEAEAWAAMDPATAAAKLDAEAVEAQRKREQNRPVQRANTTFSSVDPTRVRIRLGDRDPGRLNPGQQLAEPNRTAPSDGVYVTRGGTEKTYAKRKVPYNPGSYGQDNLEDYLT